MSKAALIVPLGIASFLSASPASAASISPNTLLMSELSIVSTVAWRCGNHGCWEVDRNGNQTGRIRYFTQPLRRGFEIRCGNHGCWEVDAAGRPTGRKLYY